MVAVVFIRYMEGQLCGSDRKDLEVRSSFSCWVIEFNYFLFDNRRKLHPL